MRRALVSMGTRMDAMRNAADSARRVAIDMVRWIDQGSEAPLPGCDGDKAIREARKWAKNEATLRGVR